MQQTKSVFGVLGVDANVISLPYDLYGHKAPAAITTDQLPCPQEGAAAAVMQSVGCKFILSVLWQSKQGLIRNSFNESLRLEERYVKFNVAALKQAAARAVNKQDCVRITKLAEGGFNKVFLLTMDDGQEVIARIPTPIAGPSHHTTASEVATMEFLGVILRVPVPRVFTYSAIWLELSTEEMKDVLKQIIDIEKRMFSYKFPAYGSLYYKHDAQALPHASIPHLERFCIGPLARRQFWFNEREDMSLNRGPWKRSEDAIVASAQRESAWLANFAKPKPRRTFLLQTDDPIDPHDHQCLLSKFLRIGPYLTPKDAGLSTPILRHPYLSLPNIFLAPNSTKILSIID
ncbi:hypothetical protein AJ79_02557 [Helicocarpus griseus UAMH5409]|uniref:Aminoglycoside phosphotransferase domain-containing protein n=1 Tax=Helicocarpus griseus UAMH5409 TaxID=1447875 RepID=A0A2B7Y2V1_9EURO|nr:hypothetical protein AJ79_02557 [Helicocarpus griseus UAMH5409]